MQMALHVVLLHIYFEYVLDSFLVVCSMFDLYLNKLYT